MHKSLIQQKGKRWDSGLRITLPPCLLQVGTGYLLKTICSPLSFRTGYLSMTISQRWQMWNRGSITQNLPIGCSITITPQLAILNLNIDDFPPYQRSMITHVLLATKLLITRNWKSDNIPSLTEVTNLVQTHFTYETLLSRSKQSHTKTLTRWNPWVLWYSKKN